MYVAHDDIDIPRATHKIDRSAMKRLFCLSMDQPWLENKQEELLDLWDICESAGEQHLVCDLLSRFCYLRSDSFSKCLSAIERWASSVWLLTSSSSVITTVNRKGYSDSSDAILWHIKAPFGAKPGWNTTHFVLGMGNAVKSCTDGHSILIVDEFSGTGITASKAMKWLRGELIKAGKPNVKLYFACIAAMADAVELVSPVVDGFFSCIILQKGIEDYYEGAELSSAQSKMLRMESALEPKVGTDSMPPFGFRNSQSLYALEGGNVPNNVFPIFWWKWLVGAKPRKTLFNRL